MDMVDHIVGIINQAIDADHVAMKALFENRVPCNSRLAEHPTIQVLNDENVGHTIGLLGILCGIAGTRNYKGHDGFSNIWAVYNVDCPEHGPNENNYGLKVGDKCPIDGCDETLILGDLLRVERVPEESKPL